MSNIPPKVEKEILAAFSGGLVPSRGTGFVQMGRDSELTSVMSNLASTGDHDGLGVFRFVVGQYGSGKSFMLQFIREVALGKGFVVLDADITRECRLTGSSKEGLKLYRELIKNMSTKTQSTGGALEIVLNNWISSIRKNLAKTNGIDAGNVSTNMILMEIRRITSDMSCIPMYSDFIRMVSRYWIASNSQSLENNALRWLKGEYEQRSMARNDLDIGIIIIDDSNWFQFIKVWTRFVISIGYKGLVLIIDEGVNLAKLGEKARVNNYDNILAMYNDIYSGNIRNLSIFMSETPASIDDTRRGLYSYEPLRSRLEPGRYINGFCNPNGPVMNLRSLKREEITALLQILSEIYSHVNKWECPVTTENIELFVNEAFRQSISGEVLPRIVCREFLATLEIMRHERKGFLEIAAGVRFDPDKDRSREDIDGELDV